MTPRVPLLIVGLLGLLSPLAHAERADRGKPVNIEADKATVDERKKVHIFEGRVVLTQGTLQIKGDRLTVTQDGDGFQKGVATSEDGLASFRQRRDGSGEYVNGQAKRIEYDGRTQKTYLYTNAHVVSGKDEVRGQYIQYDGYTGQYVVTNSGSSQANSGGGRVRAVIQPKQPAADAAPATTPAPSDAAPATDAPAQ
ncbi:lipopolysaccharide transport periplasmic protein LptA [Nitrogeniibacter mangrovi]|uniref:Lipopolysaccharide export system protein LptA n=1 Tax=Nitrogeniibacter mangrovi TaxID=2016596 RepID=A0A6C1B539_9RHOO|nr:lipopolysaccharide transport periplasmic protein LptA [Nitrogeniibacter mangrovi]QID18802.1 lipopolysaccharide transport periplasmic protein LptA [Nitrogeniibacter mangrovi]